MWRAMESHVASGEVKHCGISNLYDAPTLARWRQSSRSPFRTASSSSTAGTTWRCVESAARVVSGTRPSGRSRNKKIVEGRAVRDA